MPIVGNLSEFPLPEVLLLIGSRTGRLRLYDVPGFAAVEMDVSEGLAHALRIGEAFETNRSQIVAELSFIVETEEGMFAFSNQPIAPVKRSEPLTISELVMSLVVYVDEKLAKRRALLAPQLFFILVSPAPYAWLEPELNRFFQQSRRLLAGGVRPEDLAEYMGLPEAPIRMQLEKLQQLGFVRPLETSDVETMRRTMLVSKISDKSEDYLFDTDSPESTLRPARRLQLPRVSN